jgi:hypothetical protein
MAPRSGQPFKPGQIVGKVPVEKANLRGDGLTDAERAVVEAAGADPNNPPDLWKSVAAAKLTEQYLGARKEAMTVTEEERKAITPRQPLNIPTPVDINELQPEERKEIEELLVKHRRQEERAKQKPSMPPQIANIPGMKEAWDVAQEPVITITEKPMTQPQPPRPANKAFNPVRQAPAEAPMHDVMESQVQKPVFELPKKHPLHNQPMIPPREAEPEAEYYQTMEDVGPVPPDGEDEFYDPTAKSPEAGATDAPHNARCPHCGFDQDQPAIAISEMDKSTYIQEAILGGKRFRKEYMLFGDRVRVVFRDLTPLESTHARIQAEKDAMAGTLSGMLSMMERVTDYRTVMAIASLQRGNAEVLEFEEGGSLIKSHGTGVLPELLAYFNDQVFNNDSFKRAVCLEYSRFSKLLQTLEARASLSDF